MTTARSIISGALRFGLNRLSPGEALDADTADVCLEALNSITDEMNGGKAMLFRQILTAGTVNGVSGTLGTTWAALAPGDQILGSSYSDGTQDIGFDKITMEQYQAIPQKSQAGDPMYWAHDGLATVFFWPAPVSKSITLRTQAVVSDFADLDTDYSMPKGYKSALQDLLAEKMAPTMVGDVPVAVARKARAARLRLMSGMVPAIINAQRPCGNILTGW